MKNIRHVFSLFILLLLVTLMLSYTTNSDKNLISEFFDEPLPYSGDLSINSIGNANYYNANDGNYYADPQLATLANDNTGYILDLFRSNTEIFIPEGNYLCHTKLTIEGENVKITGDSNSKLIFDAPNFSNFGNGAVAECLVVNGAYKSIYDEDSAQSIEIRNIIFEYKRSASNTPKSMLLFGNIKRLLIDNCEFYADFKGYSVTNLDLYAGCKNVQVTDCKFINTTRAESGGCIWVRNLTSAKSDIPGNVTENVVIENCSFVKDSKDEVIAVFPCRGHVQDVTIENCDIRNHYEDNAMVLSVYSSDNNYYGSVKNVVFDNNQIYSSNTTAFIIMIGMEGRKNKTSSIYIRENRISAESVSTKKKILIYVSEGNASDIKVMNNQIYAKNFSNSTAIENADIVEGNEIVGNLKYGIVNGEAINNYIEGAEIGICALKASRNIIENCTIGISTYPYIANINENSIKLSKNGFTGIEVKKREKKDYNFQDSNINITNNTISTLDEKQYGLYLNDGEILLQNNNVIGNAKALFIEKNVLVKE